MNFKDFLKGLVGRSVGITVIGGHADQGKITSVEEDYLTLEFLGKYIWHVPFWAITQLKVLEHDLGIEAVQQ